MTPSPLPSPSSSQSPSQSYKRLDGQAVASSMRAAVADEVGRLQADGWPPTLVSISVGDTAATRLYVRNQRAAAEKVGMDFEARDYPAEIGADELLGIIHGLNVDPRVTGIIIQRPTPAHLPERLLQRAIHPLKDVEGMHPANIGDIVYNDLELVPCTAAAAVEMLKATKTRLQGLEVTVIGHSAIVGKPIAFLLMAEGATVTVCHHMTRNLAMHSRSADAVFVAVGKPGLVTGEMIKPGATVIDIGINLVETEQGRRVVGDADFESCAEVADWITPVPGGVGPVTVAILLRNAAIAAKLQKEHYDREFGARSTS